MKLENGVSVPPGSASAGDRDPLPGVGPIWVQGRPAKHMSSKWWGDGRPGMRQERPGLPGSGSRYVS